MRATVRVVSTCRHKLPRTQAGLCDGAQCATQPQPQPNPHKMSALRLSMHVKVKRGRGLTFRSRTTPAAALASVLAAALRKWAHNPRQTMARQARQPHYLRMYLSLRQYQYLRLHLRLHLHLHQRQHLHRGRWLRLWLRQRGPGPEQGRCRCRPPSPSPHQDGHELQVRAGGAAKTRVEWWSQQQKAQRKPARLRRNRTGWALAGWPWGRRHHPHRHRSNRTRR